MLALLDWMFVGVDTQESFDHFEEDAGMFALQFKTRASYDK